MRATLEEQNTAEIAVEIMSNSVTEVSRRYQNHISYLFLQEAMEILLHFGANGHHIKVLKMPGVILIITFSNYQVDPFMYERESYIDL